MIKLFEKNKIAGFFKGFTNGGLEFHAKLILHYQNSLQDIPLHGQFLLVELEGSHEAILGRITSFEADGKLTSSEGDDYAMRVIKERDVIPEDLREKFLKYSVNIRVLGVVKNSKNNIVFAPSHRRMPHVGSKVGFLPDEVLKEVVGSYLKTKEDKEKLSPQFGHFCLGEFIYNGGVGSKENWLVNKSPELEVRFDVSQMIGKRSFVFARAGYGKSNLVKLLISQLYQYVPKTAKGKNIGTILFDPDGEYFWENNGRPGLCDIEHLRDKIVLFTNKKSSNPFYQSFVLGNVKLNLHHISASDAIDVSISKERQDQQNIKKLKGLKQHKWIELVNIVYKKEWNITAADIKNIIGNKDISDMEIMALKSNIVNTVMNLHDPSNPMMKRLIHIVSKGMICIIDLSLSADTALAITGLVLKKILKHNKKEFTKEESNSVSCIAVLEEAQSVLGKSGGSDTPFVAWVKEGRKYDLGALIVTQQPGSISNELLSQGDNWFILHLLSSRDLEAVKHANAHFSRDLLMSVLNEPIPGNVLFWSSAGGKPYPISAKVLNFEEEYKNHDRRRTPMNSYATRYNAGQIKIASELKTITSKEKVEEFIIHRFKLTKQHFLDFVKIFSTLEKMKDVLKEAMEACQKKKESGEKINNIAAFAYSVLFGKRGH